MRKLREILGIRGVTEQYHSYNMTPERANAIQARVIAETGFIPDKIDSEVFEGQIYDPGKIGTRIIRGTREGKATALKIQFLEPAKEDEAEIIRRFEAQKKDGTKVRAVKIYDHQTYSRDSGYGYTIMELVDAEPIFKGLASDEDMDRFMEFFEDYRQNCLNDNLFQPNFFERYGKATVITGMRVFNWLKIANTNGNLSKEKIGRAGRHLIKMVLDGTHRAKFTHGHLGANDVKVYGKDFVLMSQAFWKYLPEHYDTTFHIWASLKDLRGSKIISAQEAIEYAERWKMKFKELPFIKSDPEFDQYFASNMRERAVGALTVDIDLDEKNQKITQEEAERLRIIFRALYDFYSKRLS